VEAALTRCQQACAQFDAAIASRLGAPVTGKASERLRQCRTLVEGPASAAAAAPASPLDRVRLLQEEIRTAVSPRERFVPELMMVEACLEADWYWLAGAMLERLFALAEEHKIAQWERPDMFDRLIAALEACRKAAGTRSHAVPHLDGLASKAATLRAESGKKKS